MIEDAVREYERKKSKYESKFPDGIPIELDMQLMKEAFDTAVFMDYINQGGHING